MLDIDMEIDIWYGYRYIPGIDTDLNSDIDTDIKYI